MNGRQAHALLHPLNQASDATRRDLQRRRPHPTGVTIGTILAVDR